MIPRLEGEKTKFMAQIEGLYGKMQKAQKQKLETHITQIEKIIHYLLPNGHLREREMNFLEFILKNPDQDIITKIYQKVQALEYEEMLQIKE